MQPEPIRIALIEDDLIMGGSILQRLEIEGCAVKWWKTGGDAIGSAELHDADIIVCDIRLPDMSGEEVFRSARSRSGPPPFIFITGYGEIDEAVRLMRLGAVDYLTKPFGFEEFLLRVRQNTRVRQQPAGADVAMGPSADMRAAEDMLRRYAATDLPVLITGETGVGKEVAAKLLHRLSTPPGGPFMAVNCAAIPADLLESEIFGHERGAFTGATKQHIGYAERAGTGTLFLDEIGDMPGQLQAKILRLIEERTFYRVGGEGEVPFRARVIAATHRTLSGLGQDREFREDLFYRLSVLPIHLKPLRDRPDDVIWLMNLFMSEAADRQGRNIRGVSALAEEAVLAHDWPGNVRELRNRGERAVAVGSGEWLMPQDLFPDKRQAVQSREGFQPLSEIRDAAERRQIERALAQPSGQIKEAAGMLGISRTTLWEKMTRFGIRAERPDS